MNQALGNVGATVVYTQTGRSRAGQPARLAARAGRRHERRQVDLLIILGGNPVYTAPADLNFADALAKAQLRVHLSLYDDETSALCQWQIPEAHFLEAWSDARAYDGTVSIVQPLIAPLYGGRSAHEVLAAMSDRPERSGYEHRPRALESAGVAGPSRPRGGDGCTTASSRTRRSRPKTVRESEPRSRSAIRNPQSAVSSTGAGAVEITFRNDPSILDGRFANNGWLQELPKPITRLTWDNAVLASPATAAKLSASEKPSFQGGEHGQVITDLVELKYRGRTIRGALFQVVGHPDDCVTVHVGYGRARGGRIAAGAGFNANAIRTADAWSFGGGVRGRADGREVLARRARSITT